MERAGVAIQGWHDVLLRGMLVELPKRKGVGKLESAVDGRCVISVFYSILRTETLNVALEGVDRAYLSRQTRVYVRQDERWRVGRVTDYLRHENGLVDYEVRFPNGRQRDFSELDLFVRPWDAPEDPAEILGVGGAESQFLHDRRQSATRPLLALRSAAQGLTSLLSAAVDLVPHQIAAVRRVLTDPVQRYLLADEVGLGKTIEAGLIIRQHLIDAPDTKVLIATPPHLCEQWRRELVDKLRVDQFGEAFECSSHADLAFVSRTPDILVVDEAHHLVGIDDGPLAPAAKRLRKLAHDAPVLLLLSATPALGEEAKFLALLNLLDPVTHPLEDLPGFRARLERRREVGRLLLGLDSDNPGLVLRQRGAELERLFPSDRFVKDLAPRLIDATRQDPGAVPGLCTALKEHIADSYRIHQRLIRSRRADAKGWEFMPRGPTVDGQPDLGHVRVESDPADAIQPLLAALEDWRFAAVEAATGDEVELERVGHRYADLLSAIAFGPQALARWLRSAVPQFDYEEEYFRALSAIAEDWSGNHRIETMVESTRRLVKTLRADTSHPKIIVFASTPDTASAFHRAYAERDDTPAYLLRGADEDEMDDAIEDFVGRLASAILVTDRCGEEGVNLSCADAIVHLDLPLSAARIEQRIGRLDRFGRRKGIIRHRILLPSDDDMSPWAAWYEFVARGFLIFNRSISDIQFLLDEFEAEAMVTLLVRGPEALSALAADMRARIEEERRSQDEQYALDRIALAEEPVEAFIQALEDAEEDEQALEHSVDQWLVGALHFKKRPFAWPEEDPFRLGATKSTLVPRMPWLAEFGLDTSQPLTWRRRLATARADVILLRPGAPFIDILERFTRWDDRGTAFVTWRTVPEWSGDLWIGFRLSFVIEPDIAMSGLLAPARAELAAWRRAQRYFAPMSHTLYIDVNGDTVSDEALIQILERPYRNEPKSGYPADLNLGSRQHVLADIIDPAAFQQICRNVRDQARSSLATLPLLGEQIAAGERAAHADLERRRNRLLRRQSAGDAMARAEIDLIESILPSITKPAIRLDAMGCFVVAQHAPTRAQHG
jgi:ATP-dependent helicase HepA